MIVDQNVFLVVSELTTGEKVLTKSEQNGFSLFEKCPVSARSELSSSLNIMEEEFKKGNQLRAVKRDKFCTGNNFILR